MRLGSRYSSHDRRQLTYGMVCWGVTRSFTFIAGPWEEQRLCRHRGVAASEASEA